MQRMNRVSAVIAAVSLVGLGAAGCAHFRAQKPAAQAQAAAPADLSQPQPIEAGEPVARSETASSVPELATVHFDFDSASINPEAELVLGWNADWLKAHRGAKVQVAGGCDQRGTVEYNLALGQRRALAVRKHYEMLGVPGSRIATISFGKEEPACTQDNEDCWGQNRNAKTLELMPRIVSGSFDRWPELAKLQARVMIENYGAPQQASAAELRWSGAGPWKRIVVRGSAQAPLEQVVSTPVTAAKTPELMRFGRGLRVYLEEGALAAAGDSEAVNRLVLNLGHEIASGKLSALQAGREYDKALRLSLAGKSSPSLKRLLFAPSESSAP